MSYRATIEVPLPGQSANAARAEAAAVRAEAAIAGGNYTPPMAGGVTRPFTNVVAEISRSVADFGADMSGVADSTAALTEAMNWWRSVSAAVDGGFPSTAGAALVIPAGVLRAPGFTILMDRPGMTIRGAGINSTLDGISIVVEGTRCAVDNVRFTDRRGVSFGTAGITLRKANRKYFTGSNLWFNSVHTCVRLDGGFSMDNFINIYGESCNYGLVVNATLGVHFTNMEFSNSLIKDILIAGSYESTGEIKFSNCRSLVSGMKIDGQNTRRVLENYFSQMTVTIANRTRIMPILDVTDNGSGFSRLRTGNTITVTALSDYNPANALCFVRGGAGASAEQDVSFLAFPNGATLSQITAGATTLIASPVVSTGDGPAFVLAVVNAVNAGTGTHGYSAAVVQGQRIEIIAPVADGAAANGRQAVFASSGGLTWVTQRYLLITAPSHGFTVGEDTWLSVGAANGGTGSNVLGMAEVEYATTDTFAVEFTFAATGTGTVSTHNRLQVGLENIRVSGNAAFPVAPVITGCGPDYVDISTAFASQAAGGTLTLPDWDVVFDSKNQALFVSDQFFMGGNINYMLIKSAYNVPFIGTRLKTQKWVDYRANPLLRSNRIQHVGPMRGLGVLPANRDVRFGGTWTGISEVGYFVPDSAAIPGSGHYAVLVPDSGAGLTNGTPTRWNGLVVGESAVSLSASVHSISIGAAGVSLPPLTAPLVTVAGSLAAPALAIGQADAGIARINTNDVSVVTPNGEGLRVRNASAASVTFIEARGAAAGGTPTIAGRGETNTGLTLVSNGNGAIDVSPGSIRTLRVLPATSGVNFAFVVGGGTGVGPQIGTGGEANSDLRLTAAGTGAIVLERSVQFFATTFGTLPAASANNARMLRLTDRSNRLAASNGTIWQFQDGTTVS